MARTPASATQCSTSPEPDLVSLEPSRETVESLRAGLPEMPSERKARFVSKYGLSEYEARQLTMDERLADLFEEAVRLAGGKARAIANWITGQVLAYLNETRQSVSETRIRAAHLAALVRLIDSNELSAVAAKQV